MLQNCLKRILQNISYSQHFLLYSFSLFYNSTKKPFCFSLIALWYFSVLFVTFSGQKWISKLSFQHCSTMTTWSTDYVFSVICDPRLHRQADSAHMSSLCTILLMLSQLSAFSWRTWYDPECYDVKTWAAGTSISLSCSIYLKAKFKRVWGVDYFSVVTMHSLPVNILTNSWNSNFQLCNKHSNTNYKHHRKNISPL